MNFFEISLGNLNNLAYHTMSISIETFWSNYNHLFVKAKLNICVLHYFIYIPSKSVNITGVQIHSNFDDLAIFVGGKDSKN